MCCKQNGERKGISKNNIVYEACLIRKKLISVLDKPGLRSEVLVKRAETMKEGMYKAWFIGGERDGQEMVNKDNPNTMSAIPAETNRHGAETHFITGSPLCRLDAFEMWIYHKSIENTMTG